MREVGRQVPPRSAGARAGERQPNTDSMTGEEAESGSEKVILRRKVVSGVATTVRREIGLSGTFSLSIGSGGKSPV